MVEWFRVLYIHEMMVKAHNQQGRDLYSHSMVHQAINCNMKHHLTEYEGMFVSGNVCKYFFSQSMGGKTMEMYIFRCGQQFTTSCTILSE